MYKYLIALAYNGKNFHGWQIQPNAKTIQEDLQTALSVILRQKICITGAGRTDTGVHATFYIADFDSNFEITDTEKLTKNLNGYLSKDIVIYKIFEIENNFNSRFQALYRTYNYFIAKQKTPFYSDFSLFFPHKLNVEKMNEACKILFDYKNFKSFEKLHSDNKTSNCVIFKAEWKETGNFLVFEIKADRFLRNMVRSIVGTMLDVGQSKISIEDFKAIIEAQNRSAAGVSVLPNGLFLTDIQYPQPINDKLKDVRMNTKLGFC
ncbi:MAG: tRNA pseudouridine(38-40) synthase TruA [Bacteroidales bacterium]|nr:tRNA pseudouridine(38-40) synthase TruA [Bacteroidales bacterium]